MSMVVWVMMGIALWHFAVFVPDRFYGGIVGAFGASILGSAIFAIPGTLLALGFSWWYGNRSETEHRPEVL